MKAGLATLGLLLATVACISQPVARDPDRVITEAQVPTLCENAPSLSPDGNTLAWIADQNLRFYDLATGATTSTPTPAPPYGAPYVYFSPDGRYAAYPTYNGDDNGLVYVVDRTTARRIDIVVPPSYFHSQFAWDAAGHTFALVLRGFTIQVYDPTEPNAPILQVAPPEALVTCSRIALDDCLSLDASTQRFAAACSDDNSNDKLVAWSYAGGTASLIGMRAEIYPPGPLLPYPDLAYVLGVSWNPVDVHELLISGLTFFTADTSANFSPTRMLSAEAPMTFGYTADGTQVVGLGGFEFQSSLRAWRLADGGNAYFVSRGDGYQNMTLSNNNVLGACNGSGAFHMWYLSRPHG